jgi:hypothetical protein
MSDAEMKALAGKINAFVNHFVANLTEENATSAFSGLAGFLIGLAASLEARASAKPEVKP